MRRRLFGEHKVTTPTFDPVPGEYEFSVGRFDVTIYCATPGAVITYWATLNGSIVIQPTTASSGVNVPMSANYGETVVLHAIARKDYMRDSDEAVGHYFNKSVPDAPTLSLYASDDGYGNNYNELYTSNSPYTPAKVKVSDTTGDSYAYIKYTFTTDGTEPADPVTASVASYGDPQVWVNFNIDTSHPQLVLEACTVKVKAVTKINNVYSTVTSATYTIGQSVCLPNPIINTDYPDTAGSYNAVNVDGTATIGSSGWKYGYDKYCTIIQFSGGSPTNIPQNYGFAICAPYDVEGYPSYVKMSLDGTTPSVSITTNQFCTVNRNFRLKWRMTKLGCTPVDNYSAGQWYGTEGVGNMILVNRFIMKVVVTDITKPIFLGRQYVWVDGSNSYGNNYGETVLKAPHNSDYTMGYNLQYAYDCPDTDSDWYAGGGACVRIYLNGSRLLPSDSRVSLTNKQVWTTSCPVHSDNSGTYTKQNELDISPTLESVYMFKPDQTGEYDFIYSYDERIRWGETVEKEGQTYTAYCCDWCNSPYGYLSTPSHQGLIGNLDIAPCDITVTDGMSVIPRFFCANVRWTGDMRFHFRSDYEYPRIYSTPKLIRNEGNAITTIMDYAFAGTRPQDDNQNVDINLAGETVSGVLQWSQKELKSIGNYVFFDCVKTLSWSNPQQCIDRISLPGGVESIGYFFNGFNCMESCLTSGVENGTLVTQFVFDGTTPPVIGASDNLATVGCHPQPWENENSKTYISGLGTDETQWHSMSFNFMVWEQASSPYKYRYRKRRNSSSKIKVLDAYTCVYAERWNYQNGLEPDSPGTDKAVLIPIVGKTSGYQCYGHDPISYPTGSIAGRFTYADGYAKLCFSKGNLVYTGAVSSPWSFHTNQWDKESESNNESHNSTGTRDLFAWATSGNNHGTYNPQWETWYPGESSAPHYSPWQFADGNAYHYAYSYPWLSLHGESCGEGWRPDYATSTWQPNNADWSSNAIAGAGDTAGLWKTIRQADMIYILRTRRTRDGYRFCKAKVNNVYGLLILPDDWDKSNWGLKYVNREDWVAYSSNTITVSEWNSYFKPKGAVFLPAGGFLNNSGNLNDRDNGYYWFDGAAPYGDSTYPSQAKHMYFSGSTIDPDGLNLVSDAERQKGLMVRSYQLVSYPLS